MLKRIRKVFLVWEFEKEEKWLNEMSAKGLQLHSVGYCRYDFEVGTPGEYVYRLEMLEYTPGHAESVQYIKFLEETGVEYIGSMLRWVYFRKKAETGGFDLYSDIASRIRHVERIAAMMTVFLGFNMFNFFNALHNGYVSVALKVMCAVATLLFGYGVIRLLLMRRRLKRDKILYE